MTQHTQSFHISPKDAVRILSKRSGILVVLKRQMLDYVIDRGSKTDILAVIGLCKRRQILRAMRAIEQHMSTMDRIKCLKNLRRGGNWVSALCDTLFISILKSPMKIWYGAAAENIWEQDVLTTSEIDRMLEKVRISGDPAVAFRMLQAKSDNCSKRFLNEEQRNALKPMVLSFFNT